MKVTFSLPHPHPHTPTTPILLPPSLHFRDAMHDGHCHSAAGVTSLSPFFLPRGEYQWHRHIVLLDFFDFFFCRYTYKHQQPPSTPHSFPMRCTNYDGPLTAICGSGRRPGVKGPLRSRGRARGEATMMKKEGKKETRRSY